MTSRDLAYMRVEPVLRSHLCCACTVISEPLRSNIEAHIKLVRPRPNQSFPHTTKGGAPRKKLTLMRVTPDTKNAKNHTKTGVQRQIRDPHTKAHLLVKL